MSDYEFGRGFLIMWVSLGGLVFLLWLGLTVLNKIIPSESKDWWFWEYLGLFGEED